MNEPILIAGGGIGGLTAAIELRRAGPADRLDTGLRGEAATGAVAGVRGLTRELVYS